MNEIDVDNNDRNAPGASITASGGTPNWHDPAYDIAGNMELAPQVGHEGTDNKTQVYVYDAWGRLVAVYEDADTDDDRPSVEGVDGGDTLIAEYQYDALNRRVVKLLPAGNWNRTDYYYNEQWRVVEERYKANAADKTTVNPAADVKYQYIWDTRYIDAPICRDEDKEDDGDGNDASDGAQGSNAKDEHLFYCNDANMNATARGGRRRGGL